MHTHEHTKQHALTSAPPGRLHVELLSSSARVCSATMHTCKQTQTHTDKQTRSHLSTRQTARGTPQQQRTCVLIHRSVRVRRSDACVSLLLWLLPITLTAHPHSLFCVHCILSPCRLTVPILHSCFCFPTHISTLIVHLPTLPCLSTCFTAASISVCLDETHSRCIEGVTHSTCQQSSSTAGRVGVCRGALLLWVGVAVVLMGVGRGGCCCLRVCVCV